jgi:hypothetical protein
MKVKKDVVAKFNGSLQIVAKLFQLFENFSWWVSCFLCTFVTALQKALLFEDRK